MAIYIGHVRSRGGKDHLLLHLYVSRTKYDNADFLPDLLQVQSNGFPPELLHTTHNYWWGGESVSVLVLIVVNIVCPVNCAQYHGVVLMTSPHPAHRAGNMEHFPHNCHRLPQNWKHFSQFVIISINWDTHLCNFRLSDAN